MNILIKCDRCGKMVKGDKYDPVGDFDGVTAGYYEVEKGYWNKFANAGEKKSCDDCMFHDQKYINIYGIHY